MGTADALSEIEYRPGRMTASCVTPRLRELQDDADVYHLTEPKIDD
ncbi:hypothetical protein [Rhizobium sp. NXC24]